MIEGNTTQSVRRGFWLKDEERSPFGLGWEYARREKTIDDNPFSKETELKQWRQFNLGFDQFLPSPTADYS